MRRRTNLTYLIVTIIFLLPFTAYSYMRNIHSSTTEQAIINSNLNNYLNSYLGVPLNTKLQSVRAGNRYLYSIQQWIIGGGVWEDDLFFMLRPRFHFFDPTTNLGLNFNSTILESSLLWATTDTTNEFGWNAARNYFYVALTSRDEAERQDYFAKTFRSVGQLMHHVEDLATPAHVRNDPHLPINDQKDLYEEFTNKQYNTFTYTGYPVVDLQTFNATDLFWKNSGKGLSEFTNSNFLSRDTNFGSNTYPSPAPVGVWVANETITDTKKRSMHVNVKYMKGNVFDTYQPALSAPINRLAAYSYLDAERKRVNNTEAFILNDAVHKEYAQFLLPRAVGYSAGLLNYFIRGTMQLTLPAQGVYATAAGSTFNEIRVKAKNTTTAGEEMLNGTFQLVVKYNLSLADPFQSILVDLGPDTYISVPEKNGATTISRTTPTELVFDLSSTPLPIWAANVSLQVVFKGKLGNELNAVAVGYSDISEPTPVDVYNNTDYSCLNSTWYRYDDPAAMAIVDSNADGIADRSDIYRHTISNISFLGGPATAGTLNAATSNNLFAAGPLQPGQLLRMGYILTDYANRYAINENRTGLGGDPYTHATVNNKNFSGTAFQNDWNTQDNMFSFRGQNMWWGAGVIFINTEYNGTCTWDTLNQLLGY